jgi:hypothetical protein
MSPFDGLALWLFFFTSVYLMILGGYIYKIRATQLRLMALQSATLAGISLLSEGEKISQEQLLAAISSVLNVKE